MMEGMLMLYLINSIVIHIIKITSTQTANFSLPRITTLFYKAHVAKNRTVSTFYNVNNGKQCN